MPNFQVSESFGLILLCFSVPPRSVLGARWARAGWPCPPTAGSRRSSGPSPLPVVPRFAFSSVWGSRRAGQGPAAPAQAGSAQAHLKARGEGGEVAPPLPKKKRFAVIMYVLWSQRAMKQKLHQTPHDTVPSKSPLPDSCPQKLASHRGSKNM